MSGDADCLLRASAPSAAAYEGIHKHILSRLPSVARIHSSIAMRSLLNHPQPSRGRRTA